MSYHGRTCYVCGRQHGQVTAHVRNGRTVYAHLECVGEKPMEHARHYQLTCPNCREVVERCATNCRESWRMSHPDHLPCKQCARKLAITHGTDAYIKGGEE